MDRNYKDDQINEVEALESIYCDDIEGIHIYNFLNSIYHISFQFSKLNRSTNLR